MLRCAPVVFQVYFPWAFRIEFLYPNPHPAHLILFEMFNLRKSDEEWKSWNFALCSFPCLSLFRLRYAVVCVVFVMSSSLAVYWLYSRGIVFAFAERCRRDCCLGLCNKDYYQREVWYRKERIRKTCFLSRNTSSCCCFNPLFCWTWYVESNTELPCCETLKIPGIVIRRLCLLLLIAISNTEYYFVSAYRIPDFTGVIKWTLDKSQLNSVSENVSSYHNNIHQISS